MATLAAESALGGISLAESQPEKVAYWQSLVLVTRAVLQGSGYLQFGLFARKLPGIPRDMEVTSWRPPFSFPSASRSASDPTWLT